MDRRAAAEIVPMLVQAAQRVADTIDVYGRYSAPAEIEPYAKAIGAIVSAHYDILRRIVTEHPDLDPGGFGTSDPAG